MGSFLYTNDSMNKFMASVSAAVQGYIATMPKRSTVSLDDLLDAVCEAVNKGVLDMGMRSSLDDGWHDLVHDLSNDGTSETFATETGYSVRRL